MNYKVSKEYCTANNCLSSASKKEKGNYKNATNIMINYMGSQNDGICLIYTLIGFIIDIFQK